MKAKGKTFIVTGGGSGMGQAITLELIRRGASVAIADINLKGMKETVDHAKADDGRLRCYELDISDQQAVEKFKEEVLKDFGSVDGLVNNAGIIQPFVDIETLEIEKVKRIMDINFYGTLYMTKAFLTHLKSRPEAHLSNTSSMGGFIPFPGQTAYSASKGAVKMLTEGLNSELQGTNVHVTLVFPGAVNTNITKNSGVEMKGSPSAQQTNNILSAESAANQIVDAIEKNKYRVMVGKDAKFLNFFYRLFPEKASLFIAKKMKQM